MSHTFRHKSKKHCKSRKHRKVGKKTAKRINKRRKSVYKKFRKTKRKGGVRSSVRSKTAPKTMDQLKDELEDRNTKQERQVVANEDNEDNIRIIIRQPKKGPNKKRTFVWYNKNKGRAPQELGVETLEHIMDIHGFSDIKADEGTHPMERGARAYHNLVQSAFPVNHIAQNEYDDEYKYKLAIHALDAINGYDAASPEQKVYAQMIADQIIAEYKRSGGRFLI